MSLNVDDMTAVERPRRRRLVSVVAVLLPIVAVAGASAWFFRSYILPPTVAIPEPMMTASADATPAQSEPQVASETTGTAPQPTARAAPANWPAPPAVRYSTNSAEIWASVPLPGPPRQTQPPAPEPAGAAGEPIASPVPLPPRRPRLTLGGIDDPVPLPRPRPRFASN